MITSSECRNRNLCHVIRTVTNEELLGSIDVEAYQKDIIARQLGKAAMNKATIMKQRFLASTAHHVQVYIFSEEELIEYTRAVRVEALEEALKRTQGTCYGEVQIEDYLNECRDAGGPKQ